ncbi:ABC transporter substrate-binding protein [Colwellia sp. MSW7]|uniref:ABC transporter substrate-binding protein n=1 Tax=Colwellia maritima TaxID=2912588 RepID=A0ABS9WY02_9GAMM|nr:ABC transporter substrate-binding protein [Colwellia maritima]MCI2282811.1 ABC transporter substrate-binding protein [Colwellia maritima]
MNKCFFSIALFILLSLQVQAQPTVRVGVLKFGTVNWEIDVIKHHQLDKKYQFNLEVTPLASKNASAVALQSNAVDIILTDWLWVNRQRFEQKNYTIFPTSMTTGGLYVAANSGVESLADLKGKKIGIAGGAVDKSRLLLQAYSQKKYGLDLKKETEPTFAVPPLLNRLMLRGNLAAVINFWHYGARLKAKGYKQLVTLPEMPEALGIDAQIPLLVWVFDQTWANANGEALHRFLHASAEAKQLLSSSEDEWQRIRPLIKAENDAVFKTLINDYRAGLLSQFGSKEVEASKRIFNILATQGGSALVGNATALHEGTFWQSNLLDSNLSVYPKAD